MATSMTDDVPESVRAFLASHIDSLDHLKVLLLLHGSQERRWGVEEIAASLGLSAEVTAQRLARLCGRMLIIQEDRDIPLFRFAPRDGRLRTSVDLLALVCHQRRAQVTALIAATRVEGTDGTR